MHETPFRSVSSYLGMRAEGKAMGFTDSFFLTQARYMEGYVEGFTLTTRWFIQHLGEQRFGEPTPQTRATLAEITDPELLHRLANRLLTVDSWSELLI
jgi:hypothetical protein